MPVRLHPPDQLHAHISPERWRVFADCLLAARARGIDCAVGGGLAVSLYTGVWHTPHDLDLLIVPDDRERMIAALADAGLADYYEREAYDRTWIWRGMRDDAVVDAIWALANGVGAVDAAWTSTGPQCTLGGVAMRVVPAEELVFSKLYVVQAARCDWPDIVNVLFATASILDWDRLIGRCAEAGDTALLASALLLFAWLAPGSAAAIPDSAWRRLGVERPPERGPLASRTRIDRLDSRPWFASRSAGSTA